MEAHGIPWKQMKYHGSQRTTMEVTLMKPNQYQWNPSKTMEYHGTLRTPLNVMEA